MPESFISKINTEKSPLYRGRKLSNWYDQFYGAFSYRGFIH